MQCSDQCTQLTHLFIAHIANVQYLATLTFQSVHVQFGHTISTANSSNHMPSVQVLTLLHGDGILHLLLHVCNRYFYFNLSKLSRKGNVNLYTL